MTGLLWSAAVIAALRAEAGVGARVRTPALGRLCAALDATGHQYEHRCEELLVALAPETVGEIAAAHGIVLHELTGIGGVEQAYFRIIERTGPVRHASPDGETGS
jgi:hypothetical protein